MTNKFSGQAAIVVEAGGAIGGAVARALAAEGMAVLLAGRSKEALSEIAAGIEAEGGRARACQTDPVSEDDVICLFHAANNEFARLDLLVHCPADPGTAGDSSYAYWRQAVDAPLASAFLCGREAMRVMKLQKSGRIINVGGDGGEGSLAAAAAASGLDGLTRALARDGRDYGIEASLVASVPAQPLQAAREISAAVVALASAPGVGVLHGDGKSRGPGLS